MDISPVSLDKKSFLSLTPNNDTPFKGCFIHQTCKQPQEKVQIKCKVGPKISQEKSKLRITVTFGKRFLIWP